MACILVHPFWGGQKCISLIIRKFKLGFLLTLLLIILICSFMYFIVLYIKKDNNLLFILDKFKGKLKVGRK